MRRLWTVVLLALVLVACSSPAGPVSEPTEVSTPAAEVTPERSGSRMASPVELQYMHPAEVDNSTLPITAVEDLNRTGRPQEYDIETYRLAIEGLVDNPLSLSYTELQARPQVTEVVLLICPGYFWDNAEWTGTPLKSILEEAGISPQATQVRFEGRDGYNRTMSLEDALADGVFLAYQVNGEPLPVEHGYPVRLVARHQYGNMWVKWLERIELVE